MKKQKPVILNRVDLKNVKSVDNMQDMICPGCLGTIKDFTWVEGGYCETCKDWFSPDIVRDFLDENA
jgi:protein-arginine kinase activator protein McsA